MSALGTIMQYLHILICDTKELMKKLVAYFSPWKVLTSFNHKNIDNIEKKKVNSLFLVGSDSQQIWKECILCAALAVRARQ